MLFSAEALRSSAALPKEKARRSLDDFPSFFPSFLLSAASCWAAGLSWAAGLGVRVDACGADGFCWTAAANESFVGRFSGFIVIGRESGEGLVTLLLASEEPRGGILTSLASCLVAGVACNAAALLSPLGVLASRFAYNP